MSEALIEAAVDLLDDSLAAVRAAIAGAPLEALAWRPPAAAAPFGSSSQELASTTAAWDAVGVPTDC